MNQINLVNLLEGIPNSSRPVVITGRMLHRLVREIQSSVILRVEGMMGRRIAQGTVFFKPVGAVAGGTTVRRPFVVALDGFDDSDPEHPMPKIVCYSGRVATPNDCISGGTRIPGASDGQYTWDGSTSPVYVWIDLNTSSINFGSAIPTDGEIQNKARRFKVAEVTFTAESEESSAHVDEIVQYWSGNIFLGEQLDHTHSEVGDGGNLLDLKKDIPNNTQPSLLIGGVEHIIIDAGDIIGLGAEYDETP